jgi:hypothetical protein
VHFIYVLILLFWADYIFRHSAACALSNAGSKEQQQRLEAIMSAAEVIASKGWMSKVPLFQ